MMHISGDSWFISENVNHGAGILEDSMAIEIFSPCFRMSNDLGTDLKEAAAKKLEESHARYPIEKSRGIIEKMN